MLTIINMTVKHNLILLDRIHTWRSCHRHVFPQIYWAKFLGGEKYVTIPCT